MRTAQTPRPTTVRPRDSARPAVRPAGPAARGRHRLQIAILFLLTLGVVIGGVWGMLVPREAPEHTAHDALAFVDLPDGTLRVDGLVDRQVGHAMPGMSVAKDVPVGMRRFAVDITLGATEGRTLAYSRRDFTVVGPGVKPVVPVDGQIDRGSLTAGQAISGSLSFDVPQQTVSVSLRYRDGEVVALPDLPPLVASMEGMPGGGAHDDPAGTSGAPDQADPGGAPAHQH